MLVEMDWALMLAATLIGVAATLLTAHTDVPHRIARHRSRAVRLSCRILLLHDEPCPGGIDLQDKQMGQSFKSVRCLVSGLPRPVRYMVAYRFRAIHKAERRRDRSIRHLLELQSGNLTEISSQVAGLGENRYHEKRTRRRGMPQ